MYLNFSKAFSRINLNQNQFQYLRSIVLTILKGCAILKLKLYKFLSF